MKIDDADFHFFVDFLHDTSGYALGEDKRYLLESRIEDVMKTWRIDDYHPIIAALRADRTSKMAVDMIEAMTINETFFFRDQIPFEIFEREVLGRLVEKSPTRHVRIWSAACSTGQEPYSIAMIATENSHRHPGMGFDVVGTDINMRVLSRARQGVFSDMEVQRGLPQHYRDKYFERDGSGWKISDHVRSRVLFRQMNLRNDEPSDGPFDFVLLRNVLIYFDAPMKEKILRRIGKNMRPGGYLLLGAAEAIYDADHCFQRCSDIPGLYQYCEGR